MKSIRMLALAAAFAAPALAQERVALAVAEDKAHGRYLTDAQGRAVYLLEADKKGASSCYDACTQVWPPLRAPSGKPAAADQAVREELIGTIKRRDGSAQVTYNGHPLYYYVKDTGRGKATGQDVHDKWGEWYLVTPRGTKLEEHAKSASAGASGERERTLLTLDENRDGSISRQEARGMPALAERFEKVDADGDGSISRYEFNTFISR